MCKGRSQKKDSHRQDTTASWTGTSLCTYAIEPPYTERYVRWCGRSAIQLMDSLLPDCKICGTLCILPLKSVKTYKIEVKTAKLSAGAPFFWCSGAIFMPSRSVMPLLAAFLYTLLFAFLCSVKKLARQHPTGFEYFQLPFAPTKSHAVDVEWGFETQTPICSAFTT